MSFRIAAAMLGLVLLPSALWGFEVQAVIKKVDAESRILVVIGGGQERTVKVATDAKIVDAKGADLADGLKSADLKDGVIVTLNVEAAGQQPVIHAIRLGGRQGGPNGPGGPTGPRMEAKTSVGLKPLSEMSSEEKYKGEDGGLYGAGLNEPTGAHRLAAEKETAKIVPLDDDGKPAPNGKIVFVSISMSNATQEFSLFKQVADADPEKSPLLTIVDCAQGGQAMAQWTDPNARPWTEADRRLQAAHASPKQVQIAWIKLANATPRGDLQEHGRKLQKDTLAVIQNAKARFPNLRIAYLASRIYGGFASTPLNPEPYAYEGAFAVRWLIQDQIQGDAGLNYDAERGTVKAPLLLWGPYLWADGATARKSDGLVWDRQDMGADGTHPSDKGRRKVVEMLLTFFKTDADARKWFRKH